MKIKTSHQININLTFEDDSIEFYNKKWVAVDDVELMIIQAISIYGDDTLENDVKLLDFFNKKLKELKESDDDTKH